MRDYVLQDFVDFLIHERFTADQPDFEYVIYDVDFSNEIESSVNRSRLKICGFDICQMLSNLGILVSTFP